MNPHTILVYVLLQLGAPLAVVPPIAENIERYSKQYQIDPYIIVAVMYHESRFNPRAYNTETHDYGLMQVHCPTRIYAPWCSRGRRLFRIKDNISVGVALLAHNKKKCKRYHKHKSHWLRHNNWHDKTYERKILNTIHRLRGMVDELEYRR